MEEVEDPHEDNCTIFTWEKWHLSQDKNGKVEENPQLMTLLETKYNKHVETTCCCILGND